MTYAEQFRANMRALWTRYSTWVVAFISGAIAYWLQMPPEEQQLILAAFPQLKAVAPMVSLLAFALARALPQTPKDKP